MGEKDEMSEFLFFVLFFRKGKKKREFSNTRGRRIPMRRKGLLFELKLITYLSHSTGFLSDKTNMISRLKYIT